MFKVRPLRIERVCGSERFSKSTPPMGRAGAGKRLRSTRLPLVGSDRRRKLAFVERVKSDLGIKAMHREVLETDGTYALHEPSESYTRNLTGENEALRSENTIFWEENAGITET